MKLRRKVERFPATQTVFPLLQTVAMRENLQELLKFWTITLGRSLSTFDKGRFPLLVKFIDAYDRLSIQVHPDDEYAKVHENGELGKTEMWYIIDAQEDAKLIFGLKEGTDKESFAQALKKGEPDDMLNYVSVKKGDMFFVPANASRDRKRYSNSRNSGN